jgi:hypothetical protein
MSTAEQDEDPLRCATDLELAEALVRLRELESAAREFCERCERGEIRSSRSYRRFQAVLAPRAEARSDHALEPSAGAARGRELPPDPEDGRLPQGAARRSGPAREG